MLEKDRFLDIKNLAKEIREENSKLFKSFDKENVVDAIKEKNEFVESALEAMKKQFSEGDKGKEEKQIFRANILIPDDVEFFQNYSVDKNIRNLMNKYAVGIEDIMSKITELNIYGKYIEVFNTPAEEEKEEDYGFTEEMIDLSSKEAESLLDEIEGLSNEVDKMDLPSEEIKPVKVETIEEVEEEDLKESTMHNEKTKETDKEFEDISGAVLGFIDQSNKLRDELDKSIEEKTNLKEQLDKLTEENSDLKDKIDKEATDKKDLQDQLEKINSENDNLKDQLSQNEEEIANLKKSNLESAEALSASAEEKKVMSNEIADLKEKLEVLERKAAKSSELIQKIYNCIPK